uniref:Polycomb group ring finger 3 n=1 Tax=Canis lupus familiaris TaxID=9615 RepID=A0A8C0Q048_CANLF
MLTRKIKLWDINAHITCRLCSGYLIDATTVTECLHTFCRSCLVKYLEENNTCPTCRIVIHQSHPLQYIGHDRTMQDIVYKLVPGLQEAEMRKQRDFYHKLGMEVPGDVKGETCSAKQHLDPHRNGETKADDSSNKEAAEEKQEEDNDYHRSDEQLAEKHVLALKHPERKRIEAQTLHTTPQVGSLGAGHLSVRVAYPVRRGPVGSHVTGKEADSPEASSPDQREQRACAPVPVHVCRASHHPEWRAAGASTDSGAPGVRTQELCLAWLWVPR